MVLAFVMNWPIKVRKKAMLNGNKEMKHFCQLDALFLLTIIFSKPEESLLMRSVNHYILYLWPSVENILFKSKEWNILTEEENDFTYNIHICCGVSSL